MNRKSLIRQLSVLIGERRLVWAGLRGDDVEAIADLPSFDAAFSIIGRYSGRTNVEALAHEDMLGRRVDLELWDIADHPDLDATRLFRQRLLHALSVPSLLLPYRSSTFLSAVTFARRDTCRTMGLFGAHQGCFEHKPWVESGLRGAGVTTIPWVYIPDEEKHRAVSMLREGPIVLRRSRTSGGEGMARVDAESELAEAWPCNPESFVAVSPFLEDALPLNVSGTVWRDGVSVHRPSVQLIGVNSCVTRRFGYAGNDFGLASELPASTLDAVEAMTLTTGEWLRSYGYRGTFGLDCLLHRGNLLFTELNPRFQGSTHASGQIDVAEGMPCLLLEHLAALMDLSRPRQYPLRERAAAVTKFAHAIVHWTGSDPARLAADDLAERLLENPGTRRVDVVSPSQGLTGRGGVVLRFTTNERLTGTGYDLIDPWAGYIDEWFDSQH